VVEYLVLLSPQLGLDKQLAVDSQLAECMVRLLAQSRTLLNTSMDNVDTSTISEFLLALHTTLSMH
jgi:hypothetical protein